MGKYHGLTNGYDLSIELRKNKTDSICLDYICIMDDGNYINESVSKNISAGCFNISQLKDGQVEFQVINFRASEETFQSDFKKFNLQLTAKNDSLIEWKIDNINNKLIPYLPPKIILKAEN